MGPIAVFHSEQFPSFEPWYLVSFFLRKPVFFTCLSTFCDRTGVKKITVFDSGNGSNRVFFIQSDTLVFLSVFGIWFFPTKAGAFHNRSAYS